MKTLFVFFVCMYCVCVLCVCTVCFSLREFLLQSSCVKTQNDGVNWVSRATARGADEGKGTREEEEEYVTNDALFNRKRTLTLYFSFFCTIELCTRETEKELKTQDAAA